jgi:preprotein translocase subunit SecB
MKLTIAQIVLERAEFKHRDDYLNMPPATPVQSAVNLQIQMQRPEADASAPVIVRLIATSAEDAIYQFSVAYVVFYLTEREVGDEALTDLDRRLLVTGSTMLFPFIRETVASLSGRGRFGPSWLAPTNFNTLVVPTPPEALASSQP